MSSALVRLALEFVDPEETDKRKRIKRRNNSSRHPTATVQDLYHPYNQRNKKSNKQIEESKNSSAEENIKKLLALSTPVAEGIAKDKIIERAIKGKPLLQKVEKPKEDESSILFPEETFNKFEETYFCS